MYICDHNNKQMKTLLTILLTAFAIHTYSQQVHNNYCVMPLVIISKDSISQDDICIPNERFVQGKGWVRSWYLPDTLILLPTYRPGNSRTYYQRKGKDFQVFRCN